MGQFRADAGPIWGQLTSVTFASSPAGLTRAVTADRVALGAVLAVAHLLAVLAKVAEQTRLFTAKLENILSTKGPRKINNDPVICTAPDRAQNLNVVRPDPTWRAD